MGCLQITQLPSHQPRKKSANATLTAAGAILRQSVQGAGTVLRNNTSKLNQMNTLQAKNAPAKGGLEKTPTRPAKLDANKSIKATSKSPVPSSTHQTSY